MEKLVRKYPGFSLCGLNCLLCPRHNAEGESRCPGCGGPAFAQTHPTCAVATCNRKRDNAEFCFECRDYPCKKYEAPSSCDSFVSYRSVLDNFRKAKDDLEGYKRELERRGEILRRLLADFNDGKSKGLYCLVANDAEMEDLETLCGKAREAEAFADAKERAKLVKEEIKKLEEANGFEFKLRK